MTILVLLGIVLMASVAFTASSNVDEMTKKDYARVGVFIAGAITFLAGLMLPPMRNVLFTISTTVLAEILLGASLLGFGLFLTSERKKTNQPKQKKPEPEQEKEEDKEGVWIFVVTLTIAIGLATAVYFLVPGLGLG